MATSDTDVQLDSPNGDGFFTESSNRYAASIAYKELNGANHHQPEGTYPSYRWVKEAGGRYRAHDVQISGRRVG